MSEEKPLLPTNNQNFVDHEIHSNNRRNNYAHEVMEPVCSSTSVNDSGEGDEDDSIQNENQNYTVSGHHIDEHHHETTNMETMVHLIKGNLGTGILAMPDALRNSGLFTGVALLPLVATICIHCMHILVRCSNELKERSGLSDLDYADVGEQAFRTGPLFIQPFALTARRIIKSFLIITQLGFCCVYVVFISANLKQVIDCKFPGFQIDIHGYMAILLIPLLAISMIRSLKVLAPFSLLSNFLLFLGLCLCFYYLLQDIPKSTDRKSFSSWKEIPIFLGISIYAFEGIGVVLPLERNMMTPRDFTGWNGVLNTAMIIVTCLYIAVGFFGYLKYGDSVSGSITLNLPPGDNLAQLAKVLMALAIYLTYSLMLYVPVQILWQNLKHRFNTRRSRKRGEFAFRAFLVFCTFVCAAAIPNIGLFISLVGAMSSSTLAIIFPPLIEMVTFWSSLSRLKMAKCCGILVFGILCFLTGTYASLSSILSYFNEPNLPPLALVC